MHRHRRFIHMGRNLIQPLIDAPDEVAVAPCNPIAFPRTSRLPFLGALNDCGHFRHAVGQQILLGLFSDRYWKVAAAQGTICLATPPMQAIMPWKELVVAEQYRLSVSEFIRRVLEGVVRAMREGVGIYDAATDDEFAARHYNRPRSMIMS